MRCTALATISLLLTTTACSKAPEPKEFLIKAIRGDNSETQLGAMAAQRGGPAVRAYGQTLVADHTKARKEAERVAVRHGVQPPTDLLPEASDEQQKLAKLQGADFDKEFANYMVKDHKEDVSDFTKEAQSHAPDDVRALAQGALPDLQKHLDMAKRLS